MMKVRFLRVLGVRCRNPEVFAVAEGQRVRWNPRHGWTCDCDAEGDACDHVDAVADLLDDRVLGDDAG